MIAIFVFLLVVLLVGPFVLVRLVSEAMRNLD